ncbi:hypothetical protein H7E65_000324 [Salmonella enterica]|nr:hypothetical protein [Salmonella enterica]EGB2939243.1 hypothetical protein [Salmonella enterica]EGK4959551.1 hypothetical protein [Salmonella enterica]EHF6561179.1 hypothetical protein [Salmonella enterica]EHG4768751.1 hypothetical protein [Salmonella enterica]
MDALVFPAPAGINRLRSLTSTASTRVPRVSGDKPLPVRLLKLLWSCSPRQRG